MVFGGREGDGKKRIVNDIFIFDTGWFFHSTYMYREALLVPTKSRQTEASVAKDGSQQLVVEWFPNNYLRGLERFSSIVRCHLY